MANLSPSTVAINSIAQCVANAAEAARSLDAAVSQDIRSLLHLAACEAERVRKMNRKAAAAAKLAPKQAEKKAKAVRPQNVAVKVVPQQRSRRKAATLNGAAH
jgi:hypothetical protein